MSIMYLVMKVGKWEDMEFEQHGIPHLQLQPNKGQYGYCHVYTDYKIAVEHAGDERLVLPIRAKELTKGAKDNAI